MSIFQRKGKRCSPVSKISPEYLAELQRLPYAEDFDLPREAERLARVHKHDLEGGSFEVRKIMGKHSPVVIPFDEFPSESQILEAVFQDFGGGRYSVHLKGQPGAIKSFNFPGRSTFHAEGVPPKTQRQELQDQSARYASEFLEKEISSGSEIGRQLKLAMVAKSLGIELPEPPPEPSLDEQWVTQFLDDNPEAKTAYIEAKLKGLGVELPKTKTEVDRFIDQITQMASVEEAVAKYKRAGEPEPNLARDFLQAVAAVGPDLVGLLIEMKAKSGEVPVEPPPTDPQPEQIKGSDGVQETAGPEPSLVSQSPPIQESAPAMHPPQEPDQPILNHEKEAAIAQHKEESHTPVLPIDGLSKSTDSAAIREEFQRSVDWFDLEQGISGDPADYVEQLIDRASGEGTGYGAVLGYLQDPEIFVDALNEAVDALRGEQGRGEDYEVAVLVLRQLTETDEGGRWLESAKRSAIAMFEQSGRS